MTEQWGAVVAALIAGAAGLIGVLMGRRQVTDQAQVEHEQWLRGQRQEAYIAYLDAVDQALKKLSDIIDSADLYEQAADEGRGDEIRETIDARGEEAWDLVRRPLERVYLLGPQAVNAAAHEVDNRLAVVKTVACFHGDGHAVWPDLELYKTARGFVREARNGFLGATREVIRAAPQPSRTGRWRRGT